MKNIKQDCSVHVQASRPPIGLLLAYCSSISMTHRHRIHLLLRGYKLGMAVHAVEVVVDTVFVSR